MDDSHVHTVMDLRQFEEMFSAYQRKETDTGSSLGGTLRRRSVLDRPKELSVIESKRAQNCSIVLSTLKMTNEEVSHIYSFLLHIQACIMAVWQIRDIFA